MSLQVTFIGTANAFNAGGRRQSCVALRTKTGTGLLDCGMNSAEGLATFGIKRPEISTIVITHLHGDHWGGLVTLLQAMRWEDYRPRPLRIYGPPGLIDCLFRLLDLFCIHVNLEDPGWSWLELREYQTGRFEVGSTVCETFKTKHSTGTNAHGLRLKIADRVVVYSGDTGWFDKLPHQAKGSDLFICECTQARVGLDTHLSAPELIEHHSKFSCGRIVLTHFDSTMSRRDHPDLIRLGYELADDGLTIEI